MAGTRLEEIATLLDELRNLPADEQSRFLEQRCPEEDVRNEVRSLASIADEASTFFDDVVDAVINDVWSALSVDEKPSFTSSDPLELVSSTVGRYLVEQHLGSGGMGIVYKAKDVELDRSVALKFLSPALVGDEEAASRFLREARAVAALEHPRIATIYEIGQAGTGLRYLAMAYCAGESLKGKISRGMLSMEEIVSYAWQIAEGLQGAHRANIIHRDVKPANVMITPDGQVRLVDFGLARALANPSITHAGRRMGTAAYMSPEQVRGAEIDARTDLWALGVVLYEMLAGVRPFRGARETAVLYAVLHEEPTPLRQLCSHIPSELEQIVTRLLSKEPSDRYQTAIEVARDLKALTDGTGSNMSVLETGVVAFQKTVAVLSFETLGKGEPDVFATGMGRGIQNRLSGVAGLRVISRDSVRAWQSAHGSIGDISRVLQVGWLIEGEVKEAADHLHVHVRLINVRTDRQVWAKNTRRSLTTENIFQIESEIVREITDELRIELTQKKAALIEHIPTGDLDAYRFLVRAYSRLDDQREDRYAEAVDLFERALHHDAECVLAWTGLARALVLLSETVRERRNETLLKATRAIEKAEQLNPSLADVQTVRGLLHSTQRERREAVAVLTQALRLEPNNGEAIKLLSWNYLLLGEARKGLRSAERAVKLSPLATEPVGNLSASALAVGDWERALREAQHGKEMQPQSSTNSFFEGLALYHLRRYDEAIAVLRDLKVPWAGDGVAATLALAYVATGRDDRARKLQARLEKTGGVVAKGLVHAAFGEVEAAMQIFLRTVQWDDWSTLAIAYYYPDVLRPVRGDVRWTEVLANATGKEEVRPSKMRSEDMELDEQAIAVIPFNVLGGRRSSTSFAVGFHHDLLSKLSRISGLSVMSSAAVQRYEDERRPLSRIARELKVGTIVKGGIQELQGRLRLHVQLIDARNERLRWAESYDRELSIENLFDIQTELTTKIAESLRTNLTAREQERVRERPIENSKAHILCMYGRTHMARRTETSVRRAFDFFQQAREQAPAYALAWAGLAEVLALATYYGYDIPGDKPNEMDVARRAVELNPLLPEAHCSLGIRWALQYEGPKAVRSLEQAVEIQPSYAEALIWLGWMYMILGNAEAGIEPAERSAALDPIAPYIHAYLGEIYLATGQVDKALTAAVQARELQPDLSVAHLMEGLSLYYLSRFEEATFALRQAELTTASQTDTGSPVVMAARFAACTLAGFVEEAQGVKRQIERTEQPFATGMMHAVSGDHDLARDAFMSVKQWGIDTTPAIRYFFPEVLAPLRKDARYPELRRQIDASWGIE